MINLIPRLHINIDLDSKQGIKEYNWLGKVFFKRDYKGFTVENNTLKLDKVYPKGTNLTVCYTTNVN